MQDTITQISNKVTEKWTGYTKSQKLKIGIGAGAVIVALIIAIVVLSKPQMQSLFTQRLDQEQAAKVVEVLENEKIGYKLKNEGLTILVNKNDFDKAKIVLYRENVPKGGYTFEDAMTNSMSTTEDEKKAKQQHYREAELERTLVTMDAIESADVTLVVPEEKNAFLASKQKSSASVLLTLNAPMDNKQIQGVARLISGSVQNLAMSNINIVDADGNNLYIGSDEDGLAMNKQQELKKTAENDVKGKVTELLSGVYDEVKVSPTLMLDFDKYEAVTEKYTPQFDENNRGIISQESVKNSSSKNTQAGGEPGTATNGGDAPVYQAGAGGAGESKDTSKDIVYANDKTVATTSKNQGTIDYKKSSLAVHVYKEKIYDEAMLAKELGQGMTWAAFKDQNKDIKDITVDKSVVDSIKAGTGIENVVVYGYEKPVFVDKEPFVLDWKAYLPFVLILLIIIIVAVALLKFRRHDDLVETEPELEVEEMLKVAKEEVALEEIELKESLETKRQIEKFVDEKPEAVANLLRNWLSEDDWE
ncbi:MAG: flagellar basal-body MS-ring/collar protein FliF [Cellulosilyticaceae bacterium]